MVKDSGLDEVVSISIYFLLIALTAAGAGYILHFGSERKKAFPYILMLFAIWGLFLFYRSVHAYDAAAYEIEFHSSTQFIKEFRTDWLSFFIMAVIKNITDNYSCFRMFAGVMYFMPVFLVLKKEDSKRVDKSFLILLNLIYPFMISIVTLRNTMAASLVQIVLYAFFKSKKRLKHIVLTITVLICASLLHNSALFFLVIFIIYVTMEKSRYANMDKIYTGLILTADAVLIFLLKSGLLLNFLRSNITAETDIIYLNQMETAGNGWILLCSIQILFTVLIIVFSKNAQDSDDRMKQITRFNYVMLLLLPFYTINIVFFRLYRKILLLNSICYSSKLA